MNVQLEYIDQTFAYYASIMELPSYYAQNYAGIIGENLHTYHRVQYYRQPTHLINCYAQMMIFHVSLSFV